MSSLVPIILKEIDAIISMDKLIQIINKKTSVEKSKIEFRIKKCIEKKILFEVEGKITNKEKITKGELLNFKGKKAEEFVFELAENTFLTDWCYPNPLLPNGKELCDLLVVFDDVLIIWQIKDLKLDENNNYSTGEVKKNMQQLLTAKNRLLLHKMPIELDNPRRGKELFDASKIKQTYLISALLGDGEDYFSFMEKQKGNQIHTFTRKFTELVLNELNTIADFTDYLNAKENQLSKISKILLNGEEEELLAYYLMNQRNFEEVSKASFAIFEEGMWNDIKQKPEFIAKKKEDEISKGWDELIEDVHRGKHEGYEYVARELARPNRFERRMLAKAFFDAHVLADKETIHTTFRRIAKSNEVTYCFVFVKDDVDRETRRNMLSQICFVARGLYKDNKKVIGVATEMKFRPTCSYDYCFINLPNWGEEEEKKKAEIQAKNGFFNNPKQKLVHEDEYPVLK